MWQRFTERARRIVFFAQEEAGRLGENYVSTEHLLLGLVRENDSVAARILDAMGISLGQIRGEIERNVTKGDGKLGQDFQLTPRAKRVIDLAYDEARNMQHNYIGTEHLLLGLIREGEGLAGRVLDKLNVKLEPARRLAMQFAPSSSAPRGPQESPMELEGSPATASGAVNADRLQNLRPISKDSPSRTPRPPGLLAGKDLLSIAELTRVEIELIFQITRVLKDHKPAEEQRKMLEGKTLAMIFEKPSLRTRVSFETGIFQLGGHGIYLSPSDISLGKRESTADIARNLERMCDIIMARVFEHDKVTGLADNASIPVINGLSDLEHPCQALADFYTILEKKRTFEGRKLAFIGDGNNVAHSLMLLAAKVGTHFAIGCPKGYEPSAEIVARAQAAAEETGATISVLNSAVEAVKDADVVYTDVWASMGQEAEAEERAKLFAKFQVNSKLMKKAKPDAIFMHCLPAHRGSEVTDEVIDSKQSVVFDQAENRLHAQKAVMVLVAG
jgi:ornithine carbamoyltransferase